MGAGSLVASCAPPVSIKDPSRLMVDCEFRANKHIHLHVSEERGAVTLVSNYTPGKESTHSEDLRKGIESEGRLISPGGNRFELEIFLLNDDLGEDPGEIVRIQVADDGNSQIKAKGNGGAFRVIDTGTCTLPDAAHS